MGKVYFEKFYEIKFKLNFLKMGKRVFCKSIEKIYKIKLKLNFLKMGKGYFEKVLKNFRRLN